MPRTTREACVRFFQRPANQIAADAVPLLTAVYFTVKKLKDTSIEAYLDRWFKEEFTNIAIGLAIAIIIYSCLIKIGLIIIDKTPTLAGPSYSPSSLSFILKRINSEIEKHINDTKDGTFNKEIFEKFHPFKDNIQLILADLQGKIIDIFKKHSLGKKDVFISIYVHNGKDLPRKAPETLEYTMHIDPACCDVETKTLTSQDPYRDYLGVKAFTRQKVIIEPKAWKKNYILGDCERRKSIKHYCGFPLVVNNICLGLVNIEIHNKEVFSDKQSMERFYSDVIYPYTCQFEYQLNKRIFFELIRSKFN